MPTTESRILESVPDMDSRAVYTLPEAARDTRTGYSSAHRHCEEFGAQIVPARTTEGIKPRDGGALISLSYQPSDSQLLVYSCTV